MRLSGLGASDGQGNAYTLPKHPRYQLRYTRIFPAAGLSGRKKIIQEREKSFKRLLFVCRWRKGIESPADAGEGFSAADLSGGGK